MVLWLFDKFEKVHFMSNEDKSLGSYFCNWDFAVTFDKLVDGLDMSVVLAVKQFQIILFIVGEENVLNRENLNSQDDRVLIADLKFMELGDVSVVLF